MRIDKTEKVLLILFSQQQHPHLIRLQANEEVKQCVPNKHTSICVALQIALDAISTPACNVHGTLNTLKPSLFYPKSTRCSIKQAHQIQAAKQVELPVQCNFSPPHQAMLLVSQAMWVFLVSQLKISFIFCTWFSLQTIKSIAFKLLSQFRLISPPTLGDGSRRCC